jgi:aromatic-L-amino-acid decarboxylase
MKVTPSNLQHRVAPLEMESEEFRRLGYKVIDKIAAFLASLPQRPVTPNESPAQVRDVLGNRSLPHHGTPPDHLLEEISELLFDHSLLNGHPRFMGYITSSPAPIGALADLLAAAVNPNVGAWDLSPIASEIEAQTVRWIAEMIGYPSDCGGLLVSGGNMANFVGFLAARTAKASWNVRREGVLNSEDRQLAVYASSETHTWIQKAADLFGLGTNSIRWIRTDDNQRMELTHLKDAIREDVKVGRLPFLVVGTAGSVGTGAIDPIHEMAAICHEHGLWFHVDGAYGGLAAALPDAPADLKALSGADSVAIDPHKWLYSPLEAGCVLTRDMQALREAFSYAPSYYHFGTDDTRINYYDCGPQNSRGFRALKVWLGLRQVGRKGYEMMISDDVRLANELYSCVKDHPELESFTQSLSITTFRYVPPDLKNGSDEVENYLNKLNTEVLTRLQGCGEAYLSNAVIGGKFVLRACIVNFRTSLEDIKALPPIVTRIGREIDSAIRPEELRDNR